MLAWRPDTMAADGSRLLTMMATLGACGLMRSRGCRCATGVRLSDVVRDAQLRGDALDAHQPVKNDTQRKGHYPAFGRSRDPELAVKPLTTLRALTWDLVRFDVPTSQVELVWKAVQARNPGRAASFTFRRRCARSTDSRPGPRCSARFGAIPWR